MSASAYNVREMRHQEMHIAERAQESCEHFVAPWRSYPPKKSECATASNRQGLNKLPSTSQNKAEPTQFSDMACFKRSDTWRFSALEVVS